MSKLISEKTVLYLKTVASQKMLNLCLQLTAVLILIFQRFLFALSKYKGIQNYAFGSGFGLR